MNQPSPTLADLVALRYRLRAALEDILELPAVVPDHAHGGVHPPYLEWTEVARIARAALAKSPARPSFLDVEAAAGLCLDCGGRLYAQVHALAHPHHHPFRESPARSREEPGLDAERLAKALQVGVGPKRIEDYNPDDFYRDYAAAIIAEYDRLASRG